MRRRLTAVGLKSIEPFLGRRTDYEDSLCPGLVFRVTPKTRAWYLVFYRRREKVRILLGYYHAPGEPAPMRRRDAPLLSLDEAREKARAEMKKADRGVDTASTRAAGTVVHVVSQCLEAKARRGQRHKKPCRPSTMKEWRRLLDVEIADAPFADTLASDLQRPEVRLWAERLATRAPGTANAALSLLKMAFEWSTDMELLAGNPLRSIKSPGATNIPERYLHAREVYALWAALSELHGPYPDATVLLLLTGVRRRMVLEMNSSQEMHLEGDEPRWIIPASGTKGHRDHVVPLSRQAVAVIKRRLVIAQANGVTHLFAVGGELTGEDRPMHWSSRWVRKIKAKTAEKLGAKMENWRVHELRHTIRTHLCETLKVRDDVADLILSHKRSGMTARYNRAELLDERRAALVAWGAWLDQGVSETKTADVLPISGRRKGEQ